MKADFKQYVVCKAIFRIAVFAITLTSCENNLPDNILTEEKHGITFSFGMAQDEVSAAVTRATETGGTRIQQIKYTIIKDIGVQEFINPSQVYIAPDLSSLTVEGLEEGDYSIAFYATTQSNQDIPQPKLAYGHFVLENPSAEAPLNVDYLFKRVDFAVDGTNTLMSVPVRLKRCVGRVEVDINGYAYLKRLITGVEISIDNDRGVHLLHSDKDGEYLNKTGTIRNRKMRPDAVGFYSFPSTVPLSGTVTIKSVLQDGKTPASETYRFENLNINEGKITKIHIDWESPDTNGSVYLTEEELIKENSYEMFTKGEAKEKIKIRTFHTNKPLQAKIDDDKRLHLTFYGARDIHKVKIMCRMKDYSNEYFQMAFYDVYPAFYETWVDIPLTRKAVTYVTETGRKVTIPAQPDLSDADCEFKIVTDDRYMKNVNRITFPMEVRFDIHNYPQWPGFQIPVSPAIGRHACILTMNLSAVFSSQEFEDKIRTYNDIPFFTDTANIEGTLILPEKLIVQARGIKIMKIGELTFNVDDPLLLMVEGMAGIDGGVNPNNQRVNLALKGHVYKGQFPTPHMHDPSLEYQKWTIFHEFGHCMGYGHASSICSYEEKYLAWQYCCTAVLHDLGTKGKLPINDISEAKLLP